MPSIWSSSPVAYNRHCSLTPPSKLQTDTSRHIWSEINAIFPMHSVGLSPRHMYKDWTLKSLFQSRMSHKTAHVHRHMCHSFTGLHLCEVTIITCQPFPDKKELLMKESFTNEIEMSSKIGGKNCYRVIANQGFSARWRICLSIWS